MKSFPFSLDKSKQNKFVSLATSAVSKAANCVLVSLEIWSVVSFEI
jgi:hypothetical protein